MEALIQKRVSSLESERVARWMGCADGMKSLACHLTDTLIYPAGDVRAKQLARSEAKSAMDQARAAVAAESPPPPQDFARAVKQQEVRLVRREPRAGATADRRGRGGATWEGA